MHEHFYLDQDGEVQPLDLQALPRHVRLDGRTVQVGALVPDGFRVDGEFTLHGEYVGDLPQKGETFEVQKGSQVRSTNPSSAVRVAGRRYKVQVHHAYAAQRLCVGSRSYDAQGAVAHESLSYMVRQDRDIVDEFFGTRELASFKSAFTEGPRKVRSDGSSYCSLFLVVGTPQVHWAGSGGYWNWTTI